MRAARVGVNLDERLHDLDQADDVADGDRVALRLERRLVRRGPAIERSGSGERICFDIVPSSGLSSGRLRAS